MACQTPIIASAVHGIPELVRPDCEALLLPACDTVAWCEGLARLLATPAIGRDLAARARGRVQEKYSAAAVLPRHLALMGTVARGGS
jgi:glycosyltransferase involved in cell wall biosynthesis